MKNNNLIQIIKQAIDIHYHIGPEIIPRKYKLNELIKNEIGNIGGFVLKNHFYPTTPFIEEIKEKLEIELYGSVVLNNAMGGINAEAIYSTSLLSDKPFFVWLPTINAKNFLLNSDYEVAPEWVRKKGFKGRKAKEVKAVKLNKNKIYEVLLMIKKCKAILATGHISWKESVNVVQEAIKIGLSKIVITHPIYQRINMPIKTQIKLARLGCYIEQCYSMYSIDKISIKEISTQIKAVGVNSVIISSDVGQTYSFKPSKALFIFAELLKKEGISEEDLYRMLVINPRRLLYEET